jgi:hypothetical protein
MAAAETVSTFPTLDEMKATASPGELPYLELEERLDWIAGDSDPGVVWGGVITAIRDFAVAARNTEVPLDPPLPLELAGHLARAEAYRENASATPDDQRYLGLPNSHTEEGLFLLRRLRHHGLRARGAQG